MQAHFLRASSVSSRIITRSWKNKKRNDFAPLTNVLLSKRRSHKTRHQRAGRGRSRARARSRASLAKSLEQEKHREPRPNPCSICLLHRRTSRHPHHCAMYPTSISPGKATQCRRSLCLRCSTGSARRLWYSVDLSRTLHRTRQSGWITVTCSCRVHHPNRMKKTSQSQSRSQ